MKKILLALVLLIVIAIGSAYFFSPKIFHTVVHSKIKENFKDSIYSHKVNSDGTETSVMEEEKYILSITSVGTKKIIDNYLVFEYEGIKKNKKEAAKIKFKLSILPEFGEKLHIVATFDDIDMNPKDAEYFSFKKPQLILSSPIETLKSSKVDYLKLITSSHYTFTLEKFRFKFIKDDFEGDIDDFEAKTSFEDIGKDFFSLKFSGATKKAKIKNFKNLNLTGVNNFNNSSQELTFHAFNRNQLQKIIKMAFEIKKKKEKNYMLLLQELPKLLHEEGAKIVWKVETTLDGVKTFIDANAKVPMPLMKVMMTGPEVTAKGEIYTKLLANNVKEMLILLAVKSLTKQLELKKDESEIDQKDKDDSPSKKVNGLLQSINNNLDLQNKMNEELSLYFTLDKVQPAIDKLIENKILILKGKVYLFEASYINKQILINNSNVLKDINVADYYDLKELKEYLLTKGFVLKLSASEKLLQEKLKAETKNLIKKKQTPPFKPLRLKDPKVLNQNVKIVFKKRWKLKSRMKSISSSKKLNNSCFSQLTNIMSSFIQSRAKRTKINKKTKSIFYFFDIIIDNESTFNKNSKVNIYYTSSTSYLDGRVKQSLIADMKSLTCARYKKNIKNLIKKSINW